ncbi:MAG TPA: zinc ribbon domain-containing protein [Terriglobia bacterium]|nr:zinc ribbon domain-containing protein [Terriglobia bacterium]
MPMYRCKKCKSEVSGDTKFCPHCGKKVGGTSFWVWAVVVVGGLMFLSYIGQLPDNGPAGNAAGNSGASAQPTRSQPAWEYTAQADAMGRGTTQYASLESVNEVNFEFPYNGGSKAVLSLRNSPKYGRDAILEISKGQFLCNLDDCPVNVRVDQGHPVALQGREAADGSSNVIFLPYSTVLRDVRRAKVLRFEANFFQEGSRVLEFHPQGFDVKKFSGS